MEGDSTQNLLRNPTAPRCKRSQVSSAKSFESMARHSVPAVASGSHRGQDVRKDLVVFNEGTRRNQGSVHLVLARRPAKLCCYDARCGRTRRGPSLQTTDGYERCARNKVCFSADSRKEIRTPRRISRRTTPSGIRSQRPRPESRRPSF